MTDGLNSSSKFLFSQSLRDCVSIPWNDEWTRQNIFRWQYQNIFPVFLSKTSNNPIEASGVSTTASFSIHEKESSWPFIITEKTLNLRQTMNACTHNEAPLYEVLLGLKSTPDLIWKTYIRDLDEDADKNGRLLVLPEKVVIPIIH